MYGRKIKISVIRIGRAQHKYSNVKNTSINPLDNQSLSKDEPKWMRFFKGHQPVLVNLERSLKNDSSEQMFLHLKSNYKTFNFSQLILSIEKVDKSDILQMLKKELYLRIASSQTDELNLTKVALLKLISSESINLLQILELQINHVFFQCIVLQYIHKLFDKFTQEEQISVLFYMFQQGFTHDSLIQQFVESLQNFNDSSKLNLQQIVSLHLVLQEANKDSENEYLNLLEEQFMIYLEDDDSAKDCVEHLFHSRFGTQGAREALYLVLQKRLDPNMMGLWVNGKRELEQFLKPVASLFLSESVRPSDRQILQKLIILYGNAYNDKLDLRVKVIMMQMQQKFQTIHKYLAYQFFTEAANLQTILEKNIESHTYAFQFEKNMIETMLYFDNIGMEAMIIKDTLSDHRQAYEIFKLQNLIYFNHYYDKISLQSILKSLAAFQSSEAPLETTQLKEFIDVLDQTQYDDQRIDDNTQNDKALIEKLSHLRALTYELGYREKKIQCQSQLYFAPIQRVTRLVDSIYLQLRTYEIIKLSSLEPIVRMVFQDKAFQKVFETFGMIPHLLERLLYIQRCINFTMPALNQAQNKMSIIFNQDPQTLVDFLEDQMSNNNDQILLKNPFYQEHSEKQEFNSQLFSVEDDQNYLIKAANSPILNIIIQHTELKQVIREALSQEWKMNYTIYPAMADFVNVDEKVALFIIEGARLMHGINDIHDATTRLSSSYFTLEGYKVVYVNHQVYSVKRENVLRDIQKNIQNFQQS